MIAIVNRTEELTEHGKYGIGKQVYTVQINEDILFKFEHKYSEGLSKCLYYAYKAALKYEKELGIR